MRVIDRRLIERAPEVRGMLAADAVLGLLATAMVLAQAILIARVAARGFEGAAIADLTPELIALVAAVSIRAAASWGFEIVGRRAATTVMSTLRMALLRSRLLGEGAAGGRRADAGEVAAAAVDGIDALEATFARYIPQVVLAMTVPIAVLIVVTSIDLVSAAIMLITLPLIPIFMWLIGRFTEARAQERLNALNRLAGHFLDVVRGLPTLRAFNRGAIQAERIEAVSDEYRRATMGTLRVAFLSGTVLELAATLGIALVAVTVGVRLVDGGIGFEAALTVLLLAPELYLPLRNLGAQFHASADGRAVADQLLELIGDEGEPDASRRGGLTPLSPAVAPIRLVGAGFAYPSRDVPVLSSVDLEIAPGETVALVGPSGAGKSTLAALVLGLRVTVVGAGAGRERGSRPMLHRAMATPARLGTAITDDLPRHDRRQRPARQPGRERRRGCRRAAARGGRGVHRPSPRWVGTLVGDGGRPLSAGERQRIGLARAFLRDAPFVVLDEPTANLDPGNAERIGRAIEALCRDRTALLIAHRRGLARLADRVVGLEAGRITTEPGWAG